MRKAQFEAMGLAVIVILISLGILLFVMFGGGDEGNAPKRFETRQLAQSTVSALMKTSVPGCKIQYEDLVEDVSLYQKNPCQRLEENSSMDLIGNITQKVLNATLDSRQIRYNFTIMELKQTNPNVYGPPIYTVGECNPEVENVEPGNRIVRLAPTSKTVEVRLWIC